MLALILYLSILCTADSAQQHQQQINEVAFEALICKLANSCTGEANGVN